MKPILCVIVTVAISFCHAYSQESKSGLGDGYILLAPMRTSTVHLVTADKKIAHTWECDEAPGNSTYLEQDGSLIRTAKINDNPLFQSRGGGGGRVRRFSWDGEMLWDYRISDDKLHHHHDVEPLPNGNVLAIAWERHTKAEAIAAGRNPETISDNAIWTETILELKPVGKNDAEVVWKWRLWDHLIQEFDETKAKYGKVADHPGKIDFNYGIRRGGADWIHMNAIDYNAERDEIALSARWFNEGWLIDHSITTEEAVTDAGNLIYRWGNPEAYQAGDSSQRNFYLHHDMRWITDDCPGAGNFLIFNNGDRKAARNYSSVNEFKPSLNEDGTYSTPFGPDKFTWSYSDKEVFLSNKISGAQRLPNGNTFVCSGNQGWLFEVTPDGQRIWEMNVSDLLQSGPAGATGGKGKRSTKGKGRGGKGGATGGSSAFRAPWYPRGYSPALETLKSSDAD